jgi:hypothetical protein
MPKLNLNLNVAGQGVAEGYEAWPEDKLPDTGSYTGKLKVCQITKTGPNAAKYPNAPMLRVGVELTNAGPATGFVAFRNLLLVDDSVPYVNQFLRSITDGSDAALAKIQKAFENNTVLDEREVNVLKIGTVKVNSPEGELPIKVSIKRGSYTPKGSTVPVANAQIASFLLREDAESGSAGGSSAAEEVAAEEADVDLDTPEETADETIFDDETEEASV